jgi:lysophospholipase L1-like esterase
MLLNKSVANLSWAVRYFFVLTIFFALTSCTTSDFEVDETTQIEEEISDLPEPTEEEEEEEEEQEETAEFVSIRLLSLGDSYTIGTGVCSSCNYPSQLADSLRALTTPNYEAELDIIAQSGWTTSRLITEIDNRNPENSYDLVTLLIGVNNQFQNQPFEVFELEFVRLLNKATQLAGGRQDRVIVLSIPDYAYSNFGQSWGDPVTTSQEIDTYNSFAENACDEANITFLNITDISREALERPELLASDGLHLSELAYSEFVGRLLPLVRAKLENP